MLIDHGNQLPVARQAKLWGISRANVYYLPKAQTQTDLALMRRIGELHLERPFAGARMLRDMLRREGWQIGRKRDNVFVERLWKSVKYEEIYLRAYETVTQARQSLARY